MNEELNPATDHLVVEEGARRERVSPRTVVFWIKKKKLRAVRKEGTRRWLIPSWAYWEFKHGR